MNVEDIARDIVRREGGFVDDPADPGGATNFGVTVGTMRRLGIDLDHDGDVDTGDVRQLSAADAMKIFLTEYYFRPKLNLLPEALQPSVFDFYVNSGSNALKVLQKLLNDRGYDLVPDGAMGPQTLKAVTDWVRHLGMARDAANLYGAARREYYYSLADARPASRKFACRHDGGKGGWITRAEEFMDPAFRLTFAQHSQRCARWA